MRLKITFLIASLVIFATNFSLAQNKTVSGVVTSEGDGMPLIGVSVVVKGTSRGVQTDFDGNYSISVTT
ncbi:carboxypeptidase-like regulatory domain-containing protein, partial [Aegicerativicinus sediminis]